MLGASPKTVSVSVFPVLGVLANVLTFSPDVSVRGGSPMLSKRPPVPVGAVGVAHRFAEGATYVAKKTTSRRSTLIATLDIKLVEEIKGSIAT